MSFFHFGPPPIHHVALVAASALAGAAVLIWIARQRLVPLLSRQAGRRTSAGSPTLHSAWFSRARTHRPEAQSPAANAAFDDYKRETLRTLERESAEFSAYLARLKHAADTAEFDRFMAERRAGYST